MNKITISGIIKDIQFSHNVNNIEYYKANVIVAREKDKEKQDIVPIKFKRFCNTYNEGDSISITGNIRTYSTRDIDGINHVYLYVFTYFDSPEEPITNMVEIDGNICKIGELRKTRSGIDVIDFIIANNIRNNNQIFNTYIPVVAWGKQAKDIVKFNIGDSISLRGHFSSRQYKKSNGEGFDLRMAYEVNIDEILTGENNETKVTRE